MQKLFHVEHRASMFPVEHFCFFGAKSACKNFRRPTFHVEHFPLPDKTFSLRKTLIKYVISCETLPEGHLQRTEVRLDAPPCGQVSS